MVYVDNMLRQATVGWWQYLMSYAALVIWCFMADWNLVFFGD